MKKLLLLSHFPSLIAGSAYKNVLLSTDAVQIKNITLISVIVLCAVAVYVKLLTV